MGYTIRSERFRYTEWMKDSYRTDLPYDKKYVMAREMYDYAKDPLETVSVIDQAEYKLDQKNMEKLFLESMQREHKNSVAYAKIANWKKPILTGSDTTKMKKGKKSKVVVED